MPTAYSRLFPAYGLADPRRHTLGLLWMGTAQLLLFSYYILECTYWGSHNILLKVHAHALADSQPHLSRTINSPVGTYFTGTQGELLYHVSSLWEGLLFYNIGERTVLDSLFIFAVSLYLHRALGKLQGEREFSAGLGKALSAAGVMSSIMYVVNMVFNLVAAGVFRTRTQDLFWMNSSGSNMLYVVLGSVLLICGIFVRRGTALQQETELTI